MDMLFLLRLCKSGGTSATLIEYSAFDNEVSMSTNKNINNILCNILYKVTETNNNNVCEGNQTKELICIDNFQSSKWKKKRNEKEISKSENIIQIYT